MDIPIATARLYLRLSYNWPTIFFQKKGAGTHPQVYAQNYCYVVGSQTFLFEEV